MFASFKSRSIETERLDRGEFSLAEYKRWQKEMWFIHRLFGEVRALRKTLIADIENSSESEVSVLELAAGSGGLLTYLGRRVRGKRLMRIGLEVAAESASSIAENGNFAVRGNALDLPFADKSIDFLYATLFLHHLNESDAARLIAEMHRVARRKLFVVDLDRRPIPYFLYRTFGTIFLQPFTREDGALSIKRAYRPDEVRRIAKSSGLNNFTISRSAVNRLILSAEA